VVAQKFVTIGQVLYRLLIASQYKVRGLYVGKVNDKIVPIFFFS